AKVCELDRRAAPRRAPFAAHRAGKSAPRRYAQSLKLSQKGGVKQAHKKSLSSLSSPSSLPSLSGQPSSYDSVDSTDSIDSIDSVRRLGSARRLRLTLARCASRRTDGVQHVIKYFVWADAVGFAFKVADEAVTQGRARDGDHVIRRNVITTGE